jgi:hypothetical protein
VIFTAVFLMKLQQSSAGGRIVSTQYAVVWSAGPRREVTRSLTWKAAEAFITMAEDKGVTVEMVIFE